MRGFCKDRLEQWLVRTHRWLSTTNFEGTQAINTVEINIIFYIENVYFRIHEQKTMMMAHNGVGVAGGMPLVEM